MPIKDPILKNAYARKRWQTRRDEWFAGKKCAHCGTSEGLTIHHRNKSDKVTHRIWCLSYERIEEETAKCDVLCLHCHMALHAVERTLGVGPGKGTMYWRGCRWEAGREARNEYQREWREKQKALATL